MSPADAARTGDAAIPPDAFIADMLHPPPSFPSGCLSGQTATTDGHHNAGYDCLQCHTQFSGCGLFTLAGTLFTGASSTTGLAGAIIDVLDSNGVERKLVTSQNGNFYTSTALTYPVRVRASACPNNELMPNLVVPSSGGCNQSGCHDVTRIYFP